MLTRASLFKELGGYTEELPINFNDVDYCLKAQRAGYVTVYAPRAELIHYQSMSRVPEVSPCEDKFFARQWAGFTTHPCYNESMLRIRNPNYDFAPSQRRVG
jgi:hypothetical protein